MLNSYLFIIALSTVLCWSDSYMHSKRLYSSKLYAKQYENGELVSLLHPDAIKLLSSNERLALIDNVQQYIKTIDNSQTLLEILTKAILNEKMSNKSSFKDIKSLLSTDIAIRLNSLRSTEKHRLDSNYIMNRLVFNINWKSLPIELKEFITNCIIDDATQNYDIILFIDTLWCLAKVKFDYKHTSPTFKRTIEYILSNNISHIKTDISKLLYSLAQINLNFNDDLKSSIRINIFKLLEENIDDMSESEVVNSIYSLGKMDISWKFIPLELKSKLLNNIERVLPVMKSPGLANTIWSLGKTGILTHLLTHSLTHLLTYSLT